MRYEKPQVVATGSAVTAIQTPDPNPKFSSGILDSAIVNQYHTLNAMIEKMFLDPRLSEEETGHLSEVIRNRTRFRGSISRSSLYDAPPDLTVRLGAAYESLPRSRERVSYSRGYKTVTQRSEIPQIMLPYSPHPSQISAKRKKS